MLCNLLSFLALLFIADSLWANPIKPRGKDITVRFDMRKNTAFVSSTDPDNTIWGSRGGQQVSVAWKDEEAQAIPEGDYAYQNFTLQFLKTATTVSECDLKCQARINSKYGGGKDTT
ncbi:hypothetical protein I302_101719 [Kwoniella bestiolae CBS 10118]|uniref:Uncharacterized protein n=1 Tax=Kwoniella bestiolae CBS 10118 TaxID=1296100 RepID=A0A1B9GD05_9TREE|nr:hypothetical protein I302_00395 [Kwoniella bestiolae CBS 10118]OCF28905.1 hypothetical protein I302_00395 [Kwoniella bestiolae CBS 10118]